MNDAEVIATAIVAMMYFKGNFCLSSRFLFDGHYIPKMLGKSHFGRCVHRISELFLTLFSRQNETWKKLNENSAYLLDSYPIAVCNNYRICCSKISTRLKTGEAILQEKSAICMVFLSIL